MESRGAGGVKELAEEDCKPGLNGALADAAGDRPSKQGLGDAPNPIRKPLLVGEDANAPLPGVELKQAKPANEAWG